MKCALGVHSSSLHVFKPIKTFHKWTKNQIVSFSNPVEPWMIICTVFLVKPLRYHHFHEVKCKLIETTYLFNRFESPFFTNIIFNHNGLHWCYHCCIRCTTSFMPLCKSSKEILACKTKQYISVHMAHGHSKGFIKNRIQKKSQGMFGPRAETFSTLFTNHQWRIHTHIEATNTGKEQTNMWLLWPRILFQTHFTNVNTIIQN